MHGMVEWCGPRSKVSQVACKSKVGLTKRKGTLGEH
jgi:hypothetical protein